jgi:hypothetical protein
MEANHQAHSITVDDQDQLQITEMHVEPKRFPAVIEGQYVPHTAFVLHNLEEEERVLPCLCNHSKKLALHMDP